MLIYWDIWPSDNSSDKLWNRMVYLIVKWTHLVITSIDFIPNISSFLEMHLPSRMWILFQDLIPTYPVIWVYLHSILYYLYFYYTSKHNFKTGFQNLFMHEGFQNLLMHGIDLLENSSVIYHKRQRLESSFWNHFFVNLALILNKKTLCNLRNMGSHLMWVNL